MPPADREKVAELLPDHIRLTHGEAGCLAFEVEPDPHVPGRWNVSELFCDRAAFDAYQARITGTDWAKATRRAERVYTVGDPGRDRPRSS